MLTELKMESNRTLTENGAAAYASAGSFCLDLFSTAGAMRGCQDNEVIDRFIRAFAEDKDTAVKILFFARDVRHGLGERRVFRVILKWLADHEPETVKKNMSYIAEFGRYDDLLCLLDTPCEKDMLVYLKQVFDEDMQAEDDVTLLGKWLPSINTSSKETVYRAKKIAKAFGMREAEYRKSLHCLRQKIDILENRMREKDYTFSYEKQPSRALLKYRAAFLRNDHDRYMQFVNQSKEKPHLMHTDHIAPYELADKVIAHDLFYDDFTLEEKEVLNTTWNALPDYGSDENILAVVDTSGSMYWLHNPTPASAAFSLGLYLAEHNHGLFANHFIQFSSEPQLIEVKGETFVDKIRYIMTFCEVADTNLEAVFDLLLNTAVKCHAKAEEMPSKLVILSDMEFNECVENKDETVYESAKKKFRQAGYTIPKVVFWNLASRNLHQPVMKDESGTVLISGFTPQLFAMTAGGMFSPYQFMMDVISSKRYEEIRG